MFSSCSMRATSVPGWLVRSPSRAACWSAWVSLSCWVLPLTRTNSTYRTSAWAGSGFSGALVILSLRMNILSIAQNLLLRKLGVDQRAQHDGEILRDGNLLLARPARA